MRIVSKPSLFRRAIRYAGRTLFDLAENNNVTEPALNGERWLIRELLRQHKLARLERPFIAVDAGANRGDYTHLLLEQARWLECSIEIHTIEPSPECIRALNERFGGEQSVTVEPAAVSDANGELDLYDGLSGSTLASTVSRDENGGKSVARVRALPLADYFESRGLASVDLLKLDVEGAELRAMLGLRELLRPSAVRHLQFEYGGTTRDAGVTLREMHRLLCLKGYAVAKLMPTALEVRPYYEWMENFGFSNYVALPAAS